MTGLRRCGLVLALGVILAIAFGPATAFATPAPKVPHPHRKPWPITLTVRTVPTLAGIRLSLDGQVVTTGADGAAAFTEEHNFDGHVLSLLDTSLQQPDRRYTFNRWAGQRNPSQAFSSVVTELPMRANYTITAAFTAAYPVSAHLVEQNGRPLDIRQVSAITVKSDAGKAFGLPTTGSLWLDAVRPVYRRSGLSAENVSYSLQSVIVRGTNVVDAGRQTFKPVTTATPTFTTQFHDLTITAHDAMFSSAIGSQATITFPDHNVRKVDLDRAHKAVLNGLPRGTYTVVIHAGHAIVSSSQFTLSKDKRLDVPVISYRDLAIVVGAVALVAAALLAIGRSRWQRRLAARIRRGRGRSSSTEEDRRDALPLVVGLVVALLAATQFIAPVAARAAETPALASGAETPAVASAAETPATASAAESPGPQATTPLPLFAYYYIWFDPSSWNRAKIDYPQLGRYSSDDARVMRQQIEWAKAAGITGFIVSWKDTPSNDRRLRLLMTVAAEEKFSLAMIYQGLDFSRNPLPVTQVAADFAFFRDQFAQNPVFYRMGGKPLTIWSGTWVYSAADVARVTGQVRSSMLVLSTEKNVAGYKRIASVTDGDAYYWSSVNPNTNTGYIPKLTQMSSAIHADGKYWIAPFAAGFDAKLVGGTTSVDRNNGQTMRTEYAAAIRSSPDALGLISWNEFTENTYVEPSVHYGNLFLGVLAELRNTQPPASQAGVDSSDSKPGKGDGVYWPNIALLAAFPVVLVLGVGILGRRRRRREPPRPFARRNGSAAVWPPLIKDCEH